MVNTRSRSAVCELCTVILVTMCGASHGKDPSRDAELTVGRIFGAREFDVEQVPDRCWSKRSISYYTLEPASDGKGRDLHKTDVETGKKQVIVRATDLIPAGATQQLTVDGFDLSPDESQVLIFANSQRVWRKNTRGDYWLFDISKKSLRQLGGRIEAASLMYASFSPDGKSVAYVRDRNLYVQNLDDLAISSVTTDGSETRVNGTSDWVNEEELDLRKCYRWSPDSRRILFWQFDTEGVSKFHLVNNVASKSPQISTFAYPKVGETNSATRLGVASLDGGAIQWLDIPGDPREHYLPHADWTPGGDQILVQQFNRAQTELVVWKVNPKTWKATALFTEKDSAWLENDNPWRWIDGGKGILWLSERSGWRHAYRVYLDGSPTKAVTEGNFDVISIEAVDHACAWMYYSASPTNATQRHLYRISLQGGKSEQRSSANRGGWSEYDFCPNASHAVRTWSDFSTPPVVDIVRTSDGFTMRTLADNSKLRDKLAKLDRPTIEFMKMPISSSITLDGWIIKPHKIDSGSKLPLVMHVYGEPHGQTVRDAWPGPRGLWHWMLAQQGFAVASFDNRGTNVPRGREWRKAVHRKIGIVAPVEQAAAVRALLQSAPDLDPSRVGSWGWSGGGSMSLNALFRYPDLYRAAVAIAPVPDQLLYNTIYQERYMGMPADNAAGYRDGSPITHCSKMRGTLLLIHGTGDDNCHYQGSERLMDELIATGKRFTALPYPNRTHAVREGRNTDQHLMESIARFFRENLLSSSAPVPDPVYDTQTLRGWTVHVNRVLLASDAKRTSQVLDILERQLADIARVVPAAALVKLQKVPLYFNPERPGNLAAGTYHVSEAWLRENGRDPAMANSIEFTRLDAYVAESKRMPWLVLHLLSHAYLHRELPDGPRNADLLAAFARAKESGIYDKVERSRGDGRANTTEKAYAMSSLTAYFAEASEAYFGRNDFFPFTRDDLKKHDPTLFDLIQTFWLVAELPVIPSPNSPDSPLSLQLLKESPADLAVDAKQHGDPIRGAVLFFQSSMACVKCHDSESGPRLGPDLSRAERGTTTEQLVDAVLRPSKSIRKGYEQVSVNTSDGRTVTGILVEEKGDGLTLMDPVANKTISIPKADIDRRVVGSQSLMPEGLANSLSNRQQFLDLTKYLIEITEGGPDRARELRPAQTAFVLPSYEKSIDHAGLIRGLDDGAFKRGEAIYTRVCANCHGTVDQPGSLPSSPRFASHVFKNGADPYGLYRTITHGFNLMAPQTWMVPRQKYDVIHYLREAYLKKHNLKQYTAVNDAYLATLPVGTKGEFGPLPSSIDPWIAMDYGPSLMNTYQIAGSKSNFAYKGIAIRLDSGSGGVSRGRVWSLFDHETLRVAAAWTGEGFIDWKGIHFNGQHQIHPKIVGECHIQNPSEPGWANPADGSFTDPRPKGRDNRPYGPLPRSWAQFLGTYAYADQTILSYRIGDASVLEAEGAESDAGGRTVFTRTLEVGKSTHDLLVRVSPEHCAVAISAPDQVTLVKQDGFYVTRIPATATPTLLKIFMTTGTAKELEPHVKASVPPKSLKPLTAGGPKRWPEMIRTVTTTGKSEGPFAVDTFGLPERNPWNAQVRLTGLDFFSDGNRLAVCAWDGDVWVATGLDKPELGLTWQRIASGLFQPLGLKFRDGAIFVCCRDQIVKLHDLNRDGETDYYECFNSDHQVTEHFHEFAMGLQIDADGNFYYAKSGRHALPALIPHHGTLLKVAKDGSKTEIVATGFRAANGVCVNPDGTFFVTDQEGFWTPKNRINRVEKGGFYGNMWGYTDVTDTSDSAMKQPLCWITNAFDRSPAEMLWVPDKTWGPLAGTLLNTSYGMGKIYVVPHETVNGQSQGGMCALPLPAFPTGIMRPRFSDSDGHLYVCGMYAWAGNQSAPGGLYRVRYTGKPVDLPVGIKAKAGSIELSLTDAPDLKSVDAKNFDVRTWGLKRSQNYGSKHLDEKPLAVTKATASPDGKTVRLDIPDLAPTAGMEIRYRLMGADGRPITGTIHHTIHTLGK